MGQNWHEDAIESLGSVELRAYCEADPSFVCELDDFGYTPLIAACIRQRADMVAVLLELGSDPNFRSDDGSIPLTCAVPHPDDTFDSQIFDLLLEAGAEINNTGYETPLHCAVSSGHLDLVRYFVSRGGDASLEDGDGATPLHIAGAYGRLDAKMIRLLVALGADLKHVDRVGRTLADWLGQDRLDEILAGR